MPMPAASIALRSRINHHLLTKWLGACRNVESAIAKGLRFRRGSRIGHLRGPSESSFAGQPDCFLRQSGAGSKAVVMKKRSSDRQWIGHVFGLVSSGVEDSSAVVVP